MSYYESDWFGPYEVHECLGAGGMAIVHRASIDNGAGVRREVALKRLLPQLVDDAKLVADFIREAKLCAQLQHPNIVKIVELGQVDGEYFIAMELIAGASLLKLLRRSETLDAPAPVGVALSILGELLDALDYAHAGTGADGEPLGIIHRDVSPSNLIITDDGHVKVIDFGVAKAVAGRFKTETGLVKGKLAYMSPEALDQKPLDARADVFAAGVIAWEILTGQRLFKGDNELDTIRRIKTETPPRPSSLNRHVPGGLDALVGKALARSRDQRWASAADMRDALELVRRPYRKQAVPLEVAAWKQSLLGDRVLLSNPEIFETLADHDLDAREPGDEATATTHHRAIVSAHGLGVDRLAGGTDRGSIPAGLGPAPGADGDEPSIQITIDPPDPVIQIVPSTGSDTLDEAAPPEPGPPSVVIEAQVLDNLGEPLAGPTESGDEGPWATPGTETDEQAWDDTV
jgi:serine/threonine-protein kinase